jgi:hypothetical protein
MFITAGLVYKCGSFAQPSSLFPNSNGKTISLLVFFASSIPKVAGVPNRGQSWAAVVENLN